MKSWKQCIGSQEDTTAPGVVFRLGVTFDHNGVFHLVQLPGLLCLLTGVQIGLGPKPQKESDVAGTFPNALRLP